MKELEEELEKKRQKTLERVAEDQRLQEQQTADLLAKQECTLQQIEEEKERRRSRKEQLKQEEDNKRRLSRQSVPPLTLRSSQERMEAIRRDGEAKTKQLEAELARLQDQEEQERKKQASRFHYLTTDASSACRMTCRHLKRLRTERRNA